MRTQLLKKLIWQIMIGVSLVVLIFGIARLMMLWGFGSYPLLAQHSADLRRLIWIGLRYDLRIATIGSSPFLLVGLLLLPWPVAASYYVRRMYLFTSLLGIVALVASVCNYYYYATYGSYFDIFIFGLLEEDTSAVLRNIWDDYPVMRLLVGAILAGGAFGFLLSRFRNWLEIRNWSKWSRTFTAVLLLLFLGVYFVGMRGSLGTFPLRRANAQVSDLKLLNMLTPNAVMAFDWALGDHKKDSKYPRASDEEGMRLFSTFHGFPVPKSDVSLKQFADRTPKNQFLERHPPHVVFAVMESLSNHLLGYDSPPKLDMLGAWRPYWQQDYTFTRFLSDGNGTMESLARLLVSSPVINISQSKVQRTQFASNLVRPYKRQNYRTLFVTSGNGSWRNIGSFLKGLGFDEVIEQNDLLKRYPEAKLGAWGTFDEFTFRYVAERLEEAEKKHEKLFVMVLSITNHPPYEVPLNFKQPPHEINETQRKRLSAMSVYNTDKVIATSQYANDTVGRFIQRVSKGPLGDHTVVAVTGDHNMRGIGYPDPAESALRNSVPFYLHVPEVYQRELGLKYDPKRVGSHKDIMPTLYALSLSDTPYFRRGVNLLAKQLPQQWYFAYNDEICLSEEGAYRTVGDSSFSRFQNERDVLLKGGERLDRSHQLFMDRMLAYKELLSWQLNRQVNRQP